SASRRSTIPLSAPVAGVCEEGAGPGGCWTGSFVTLRGLLMVAFLGTVGTMATARLPEPRLVTETASSPAGPEGAPFGARGASLPSPLEEGAGAPGRSSRAPRPRTAPGPCGRWWQAEPPFVSLLSLSLFSARGAPAYQVSPPEPGPPTELPVVLPVGNLPEAVTGSEVEQSGDGAVRLAVEGRAVGGDPAPQCRLGGG